MTDEGEVAALRIIVSNVVARLATLDPEKAREVLGEMAEECKLAAERMSALGPDRGRVVQDTRTHLDEFFKGITLS